MRIREIVSPGMVHDRLLCNSLRIPLFALAMILVIFNVVLAMPEPEPQHRGFRGHVGGFGRGHRGGFGGFGGGFGSQYSGGFRGHGGGFRG